MDQFISRQPAKTKAKAYDLIERGAVRLATPSGSLIQQGRVGLSRPANTAITISEDRARLTKVVCSCRKGSLKKLCPHMLALLMQAIMDFERGPAGYRIEDVTQEIQHTSGDPTGEQIDDARRDQEKLSRFLAAQNFESEDDIRAFLDGLIGKTADEFIATKGGMPVDPPKKGKKRSVLPRERALELVEEARLATTEAEFKKLIEKALQEDPLCIDAHALRAEIEPTPAKRIRALERTVELATKQLGLEAFDEMKGHFWGFIETRPYMRARFELVRQLAEARRRSDAIEQSYELLALNPMDNQGIRYFLAVLLVNDNRFTEMKELYRQYPDDIYAAWLYTRAIAAYRQLGNTSTSRKYRRTAWEANVFIPRLLSGEDSVPPFGGSYSLGSIEEAAYALQEMMPLFALEDGLVDWLLD